MNIKAYVWAKILLRDSCVYNWAMKQPLSPPYHLMRDRNKVAFPMWYISRANLGLLGMLWIDEVSTDQMKIVLKIAFKITFKRHGISYSPLSHVTSRYYSFKDESN